MPSSLNPRFQFKVFSPCLCAPAYWWFTALQLHKGSLELISDVQKWRTVHTLWDMAAPSRRAVIKILCVEPIETNNLVRKLPTVQMLWLCMPN